MKHANIDKCYIRAEGIYLYDDEGRTYLDFSAGYGALKFEPPVTKDQIDKAVDALDATLSKGIAGLGAAFGKSALGRMIRQ